MTLTQPYAGLPPILKIRLTLEYIRIQAAGVPYSYTAPDPFLTDDQTAYNAITWTDGRTKPSWTDIQNNYVAAWNYFYPINAGIMADDMMWLRLEYLDSYLIQVLEPKFTRTTSSDTRSLTTSTGASGFQVSATKDSIVHYTVSTSTTATIGSNATSLVVLEICSTNSATAGDWVEVGRVESSQTITLAIALQSVQVVKGQITADIPAGYYAKLRNSGSGTHSESFVSGQKTIIG